MATSPVTTPVASFGPPPSRRTFAATDFIRLLIGIALLTGGALAADAAQSTISGIETDLARAFSRLPDAFEAFTLNVAQMVTSLIPLIALIVLLIRRRWKVALLLLLAGLAARYGMVLAEAFLVDRDLSELFADLRAADGSTNPAFPDSTVIASTTAVVTVAAPWLSRRWKQALWYAVATLVVLRLIVVSEPAFDLVMALGVGTVVGSLILLVFGTPRNEPGPTELTNALSEVGLAPTAIEMAESRSGALRYWFSTNATARVSGGGYRVTLRTPDERDADALQRLYRGLRYQRSEVARPYATLKQRIEHEALTLSMAHDANVRAPALVRIGTTEGGSAFLVTEEPATVPLTRAALANSGVLADLWTQMARLHEAGLAHRNLALESIGIDADHQVWFSDFDTAQTAPTERELARDVAVLLTETAIEVGAADAVAAAVAGLGAARVAPALRMLQPLALPTETRGRAKASDGLLDELRTQVNEATGEPGLALEDLERIKPKTLLIIGASTLAFYSLLPQLANLGKTADAFEQANYWWFPLVLVGSALTYVFAAISFQGAVADSLPFPATIRAQVATAFTGLVGPAGVGGFALNGRYLERAGVRPAEAGASVAVNAIAGFAVHIVLLAGFVVWAGSAGVGGFSLPDSETVLWIVAALLALIGIALAIRPVRRKLVSPALTQIKTGFSQMGRVFRNPLRVLGLFGGSAALSLTYILTLAATLEAFGGGLPLVQIGAAYLVATAIATLAPTPGGLGALESAMIAGLTGFGLPAGEAVSATLAFRLGTFWLPILPGWASMGWMQRNGEI